MNQHMGNTEIILENKSVVANSDIITIDGIECYEKDGIVYLKLEAVARGLGFTTTQNISGKEYVNVRWNRVDEYLKEIGFATSGKRPDFIPENIFYRLAMKAKNETAERFQAKVADEIIPSIRKHGIYATDSIIDQIINNPDFGIQLLTKLKEERIARKEAEKKVINLNNENDLLSQKALEWAGRPLINALVRAYASSLDNNFSLAWRNFKKEALYQHSINLNARITAYINATAKKPKTLNMLEDDELPQAISTAVALCRNNNVNIDYILAKYNEVS